MLLSSNDLDTVPKSPNMIDMLTISSGNLIRWLGRGVKFPPNAHTVYNRSSCVL